jgi:hypothetical protein
MPLTQVSKPDSRIEWSRSATYTASGKPTSSGLGYVGQGGPGLATSRSALVVFAPIQRTPSRSNDSFAYPVGDQAADTSIDSALARAIRLSKATLGRSKSIIRMYLADDRGRLRLCAGSSRGARGFAQARRSCLKSEVAIARPLQVPKDHLQLVLPIVREHRPIGVLEVIGRKRSVLSHSDRLASIARSVDGFGAKPAPAPEGAATILPFPDRRKNSAVSTAWTAHELRSPLVGTTAVLDRIAESADLDAESRDLLGRARAELQALVHSVDDLLDWTEPCASLQPISLSTLVDEVVRSSALSNGDGRIVMNARGRPVVRGNPTHLRVAISNIIRNAYVYSPARSPITVDVVQGHGSAKVIVADRGPGVDPKQQRAIFEPWVRGDAPMRLVEGHGLGLSLARFLVEAHGGSICVAPDGAGATFVIELPLWTEEGHHARSDNR